MLPKASVFASRLGLRCVLLVAALAVPVAAQPGTLTAPQPSAVASADTLRYSVRAGETLIVGLPSRVAGSEVRYEIDQAPALSWLVDRSFMWRTLPQERGTLPVRLRRFAGDRAPERLILLVEITP